jgi:hypothetical protein
MKNLFSSLSLLSLTALIGCSQGTSGGPGVADTQADKPMYGQAKDTFNLTVPLMSSAMQQGEKTEATIGIKRAKGFAEDVSLQLSSLPKGVTIEPANPVIKHGDLDARIKFIATDEAPVGDFIIKVKGHPEKGTDAQVDFKVTVTAKDSFTLKMPLLSTALKQGETKDVLIGISRDKSFNQDVALKFNDLPTGVTLASKSAIIKKGDANTQVTLTGADDAALGNFEVKVTGHPALGADASNEFKLSVVK